MPLDPDAYASFEGFLKAAIKKYWSSERSTKIDLLALLLASREAWEVAWDEASGSGSLFKGAAGAAAVTVLLRTVAGGPLGVLLTGASIASLAALYVKYQQRIGSQAERYRVLVEEFRPQYAGVKLDAEAGKLSHAHRELVIDGLMARFLERLEAIPTLDVEEESTGE